MASVRTERVTSFLGAGEHGLCTLANRAAAAGAADGAAAKELSFAAPFEIRGLPDQFLQVPVVIDVDVDRVFEVGIR